MPEDTDLVWAVDRDGWTHYGVFSGGRLVARLDLPDAMPDGARTDWLERLWDEAEAYAARRRSLTLLK
ncbi:MAG TPA: hypothetical protein VFJ50_09220 [Gemmatimonadales bacterium]|nr:hypothetical protein [Gemmatimonadales bacterium]